MPEAGGPVQAVGSAQAPRALWSRRAAAVAVLAGSAAILGLGGCSGTFNAGDLLPGSTPAPTALPPGAEPTLGVGGIKVGLILPLTAGGNAGAAGQAMRNAADMALAEFNGPNIQLLIKDDSGTAQGAIQATQQAVDEGAEIILGPLFAHSVTAAKPIARARGIPIIAFSTDTNVASSGVYLLSFLPESDVDRVVTYAISQGKRSFVAMLPSNAYGSVVEAEFKQAVARRGGRVMALEHYPEDRARITEPAKLISQAASAGRADALFIPDGGEAVADIVNALTATGINMRQFVLLGTQLWDDPKIFSNPAVDGGWYAGPDPAGFRAFAERYRARYRQDPPRPAALSYDAVALVAALVKTQGPNRFAAATLTNPSGFAGIDGVFRFRPDGTNQRGLAILKVTPSGSQVIAPASRTFTGSGI
jgi:branched-chain amino acid transport system substrate-binding protein